MVINKNSSPSKPILRLTFFCLLLFLASMLFPERLKYNFFYFLRGHNHGWIFFIIPYRAYYESFASINLHAVTLKDGSIKFYFSDIPELGYMMRTSGFSGRTLVILTAGYDLEKSLAFSKKKLAGFYKIAPYYSRYIKKKKAFLFNIYPNPKDSMYFKRDPWGKHSDFFIDFKLGFQYHPEVLNIDFNIYKILMEMLKVYDHQYMPRIRIDKLIKNPQKKWKSPALNYSSNLNRTVRLAARIMKKLRGFRQERDFQLDYEIVGINPDTIEIQGSKEPDLKMWGKFRLRGFLRKISIRPKNNLLIEDSITIVIKNPKGNGLDAHLSLKLIEE